MSQYQNNQDQVFLTQLEERTDRNGRTFLTSQIGAVWVNIFQSKTNAKKWNVHLKQKEKKEKNEFNQNTNDDDGFDF